MSARQGNELVDPPSTGRPLRRDAERNRQRILLAARELFAERGASVTLDDVAARAGVGVGTVYRRFADRNALIDALFAERVDQLAEAAHRALQAEVAWDGLVELMRVQVEMQLADRAFAAVLFREDAGEAAVAAARERVEPPVAALIAKAQAQGSVRADLQVSDFPMLNLLLMTMTSATRDVAPEAWKRYLPMILEGIRAGASLPLGAPPPPIDRASEMMRAGMNPG